MIISGKLKLRLSLKLSDTWPLCSQLLTITLTLRSHMCSFVESNIVKIEHPWPNQHTPVCSITYDMNTPSESYEWYNVNHADDEEFQMLNERINIIEHAPKAGQPFPQKPPQKECGPGNTPPPHLVSLSFAYLPPPCPFRPSLGTLFQMNTPLLRNAPLHIPHIRTPTC